MHFLGEEYVVKETVDHLLPTETLADNLHPVCFVRVGKHANLVASLFEFLHLVQAVLGNVDAARVPCLQYLCLRCAGAAMLLNARKKIMSGDVSRLVEVHSSIGHHAFTQYGCLFSCVDLFLRLFIRFQVDA